MEKLGEHICLIDVETAGIKSFVASYVLKGERVALVETGPTSSVPNLLSGLEELKITPEDVVYVAISHVHLDHGGGAGTLMRHLPNARVIVHPRGAPHLAHPEKLWEQSKLILGSIAEMYGEPEPVPESKIIAASDGMTFDVGNNVELKAIETVGHASHHQSYCETSSGGLFLGDAAGIYLKEIDVVVPTTPSPFRLDIALASLNKLRNLRPKALFYSHFGKVSDPVERLQAYARQLRLWAKIAKEGIERKESLKEIAKRIIEGDENVQRALDQIRVHPVLSETVLSNSVQGVVDFVSKFGAIPE